MKIVLVVLFCSGRFCNWEPAYTVHFNTQEECAAAAQAIGTSYNKDQRAVCVPDAKK